MSLFRRLGSTSLFDGTRRTAEIITNGDATQYVVTMNGISRVFRSKLAATHWMVFRTEAYVMAVFRNTDENWNRYLRGLDRGMRPSEINFVWNVRTFL